MPDISGAFFLIAELHIAQGRPPMNGAVCEYTAGNWRLVVNGAGKETTHDGNRIPPFSCLAFWGDLPAGIFDPYGGIIAAGEAANERTLCEALRAEIEKAKVAHA